MTPRPHRLTRSAQSLVVRSGRGPLRRLWLGAYDVIARVVAAAIAAGHPGASVYAMSGTGTDDVVPGLSDIDLAVVLPAGSGGIDRLRARLYRYWRSAPPGAGLVELPCVYDEGELVEFAEASYATFGLGDGRGAYTVDASLLDRRRILERPGLGTGVAGWRRIAGPERRPRIAPQEDDARLVAAYLELAFWWRFAFGACQAPASPHVASLCVKLVAEPARVWLWLESGEQLSSRREVLERAVRRLPEEEAAIRTALALESRLHEQPEPPLTEILPACVRFSSRVAALIDAKAYAAGSHDVRLVGGHPAELVPAVLLDGGDVTEWQHDEGAVPLCDWRALATPTHADESFTVLPLEAGDLAGIREAAAARVGGRYAALRAPDLLLFPTPELERRPLPRYVACRASDPVSFALATGESVAHFPSIAGWSVADTARRAVAEQRARLAGPPLPPAAELRRLLVAARAALVLGSAKEGDAVLPVTVTATARLLGDRVPEAQGIADEAVAVLRSHARMTRAALGALRAAVDRLAAKPY